MHKTTDWLTRHADPGTSVIVQGQSTAASDAWDQWDIDAALDDEHHTSVAAWSHTASSRAPLQILQCLTSTAFNLRARDRHVPGGNSSGSPTQHQHLYSVQANELETGGHDADTSAGVGDHGDLILQAPSSKPDRQDGRIEPEHHPPAKPYSWLGCAQDTAKELLSSLLRPVRRENQADRAKYLHRSGAGGPQAQRPSILQARSASFHCIEEDADCPGHADGTVVSGCELGPRSGSWQHGVEMSQPADGPLRVSGDRFPIMPSKYKHFKCMSAVLSVWWTSQGAWPPLASAYTRPIVNDSTVTDLFRDLIRRCEQWNIGQRAPPKRSPPGLKSGCLSARQPLPDGGKQVDKQKRALHSRGLSSAPAGVVSRVSSAGLLTGPRRVAATALPMKPVESIRLVRVRSAPDGVVPGWISLLDRASAHLRCFMVITDTGHPEVETLVTRCLQKLGWCRLEPCQTCKELDDDSDDETPDRVGSCLHEPHLWSLLWTWAAKRCVHSSKLLMWQRMNHFQECRSASL
jgi:hypothetical protein